MREHLDRGRRRLTATEVDLGVVHQTALLVGTGFRMATAEEAEASLAELALLADTAGAEPVAIELQRRDTPDPALYVGKGKAHELAEMAEALDVDVVIFDDELSPAQQRNLEKLFERDVVDRVALILDIFAQHAASQEGMLQVELAQLRYRLPRLRGRGLQLSQQGGGIGTRGPGETQLEVDRRRIQRRITKLERDLVGLGRTRDTQRKARLRRALVDGRVGRLHQRGEVDAAEPAHRCHRAGGGPLVLDARSRPPGGCGCPVVRRCWPRTRSDSCVGSRTNWSSRSVRRWTRWPTPISCCTSSTRAIPIRTAGSVPCAAVLDEIHADRVPEQLVFTKADVADSRGGRRPVAHPSRRVGGLGAHGCRNPLRSSRRLGDRLRALAQHRRTPDPVRPGRRPGRAASRGRRARGGARGRRHPGAGPPLGIHGGSVWGTRDIGRRCAHRAPVVSAHVGRRLRPAPVPARPARRVPAVGRRRPRWRGRLFDREPGRSGARVGAGRAGGRRAGGHRLSRHHRIAGVSCGRGRMDRPPPRRLTDGGARAGVHRDQGARRVAAADAQPARPEPRHRALSGDLLPHVRDGRRTRGAARGPRSPRRRVAPRPQPGERRRRRPRHYCCGRTNPATRRPRSRPPPPSRRPSTGPAAAGSW